MPIYEIFIDGKPLKIELTRTGESSFTVKIDDKTFSTELPADYLDLEKELSIKIDSKAYKVELPKITLEKLFRVNVEEATFNAEVKTATKRPALAIFEPTRVTPIRRTMASKQHVEGAVTAPMTGKILLIMVKKGDKVKAGQILCLLEAMKMENEITAPNAGTVQEVYVLEGSSVSKGEPLFVVG
ncbi:MAG: acetyl-CoA carboxylase biotin carboxyl carrier protein subunit [Candidatus Bathyarchaeota archaeon]|nr:acetyl-CoA carboxylase biotin carboxyl carrier protein subunit [Candidatus Bathyarchaeota archaeon]